MKKGGALNKQLFPQNEGTFDRMLRFLLGEFLLVFSWVWLAEGYLFYSLLVVGLVLIVTAITGYCMMYYFFNINTCKTSKPVSETLLLLMFFYVILVPVLTVMLKSFI